MVIRSLGFITTMVALIGLLAFIPQRKGEISPYLDEVQTDRFSAFLEMSIEDALIQLGDEKPLHYISSADADSAKMGEDMVRYGRISDKSNARISKFFVCTDCHNQEMESADPSDESASAVLNYSLEKDLPFLPASTFYGMYNKLHWYNGDYAKKYGDLVRPCRDTIENAIQLCAVQCSQGRKLKKWEIRSILHYMKSLEYKIEDLHFTKDEQTALQQSVSIDNKKAIRILKTKYSEANPATFGGNEIPKIEGYQADSTTGKYIYDNGCLHCHATERNITNMDFGQNKLDFKFLHSKFNAKHNALVYICRSGTYAFNGRRQYMPQYPLEKMSDEQLLDLMYYITLKAEE